MIDNISLESKFTLLLNELHCIDPNLKLIIMALICPHTYTYCKTMFITINITRNDRNYRLFLFSQSQLNNKYKSNNNVSIKHNSCAKRADRDICFAKHLFVDQIAYK